MYKSSSYKSYLFYALLITFLNTSWVYANEPHIQNSPLHLDWNNNYFLEIAHLPHHHPQKNEFVYDAPGHTGYQYLLSNDQKAFAEFSGLLDQDDPLEDFTVYLQDPVNWDPTQLIDRRFLYHSKHWDSTAGQLLWRNIFDAHRSYCTCRKCTRSLCHFHQYPITGNRRSSEPY